MSEVCGCTGLRVALGSGRSAVTILHEVNFAARAGEVVGICGPNGAGKSTLLRTLAGFLRPTEGQVRLLGKPLSGFSLRERARHFAYMHQDTSLSFDFTVEEIVAMGRAPYRAALAAPNPGDGAIIARAMAQAGCAALAEQPFGRLSGGERQRVLLARALAQDTPLLFLDEPAASLDIRFAQSLYALAGRHAGAGGTVVLVMHDLRAAAGACHRLLLLGGGRVIAQGPPREVLRAAPLQAAYGVTAVPFENPLGQWDYYLAGEEGAADTEAEP